MGPGIFVALALRFDVSRGIKNRYFNSAFLRYTGFDSDHHCNELVSCCTGEFCCSGLLPFHPLISVISEILIWSFFWAYAACSTIHCSWCDQFRCCSLFVEWRSKTGQILNTKYSCGLLPFGPSILV